MGSHLVNLSNAYRNPSFEIIASTVVVKVSLSTFEMLPMTLGSSLTKYALNVLSVLLNVCIWRGNAHSITSAPIEAPSTQPSNTPETAPAITMSATDSLVPSAAWYPLTAPTTAPTTIPPKANRPIPSIINEPHIKEPNAFETSTEMSNLATSGWSLYGEKTV